MSNIRQLAKFPATSYFSRAPIEPRKHNVPVLLLIPGNPGLVEFYTTYLEIIQQRFPKFELFCASHAGYDTSDKAIGGEYTYYSVEYQIDHKFEIIKQMILEKNKVENKLVDIYFMSHSMGSYLLPRVIQKLTKDKELEHRFNIRFVGMICPTLIDLADSQSGVYFTRLFRFVPMLVSLIVMFSNFLKLLLSRETIRSVIGKRIVEHPLVQDARSVEGWENSVDGCFNLFRNENIIRHSLMLAKNELETIRPPDEGTYDWFFETFPTKHNCKVWSFYAESDYWVNDASRTYFISRYGEQEKNRNVWFTVNTTGITHSFCVNQSVEFAEITIEQLALLFPDGV